MARPVQVVGLGGSLRVASTSRTALQTALNGAAASGADVQLIWVRDLDLPLYIGAEVARAACQFQSEGTCDYADQSQFPAKAGRASHAV
jgi:NAD(P)H-dependent FMN reductase